MELFKKKTQQSNVDIQVENLLKTMTDMLAQQEIAMTTKRIVVNKAKGELRDAIASIEAYIKNGTAEFDWYGNLSNYKVSISLDELTDLFTSEELDAFNDASARYKRAVLENKERKEKKE